MKLTILHRYFLKELLKVFALVLGCLFGLYVLIDYTSRASSLGLNLSELSQYYLYMFIERLDVLMPFALLIAGMKTLCQSNLRQELVAMRASGYSMPRLLLPLVWVGLLATSLAYVNTQWLLPQSLQWINGLEDLHSLERAPDNDRTVHKINLKDGSTLLYLTYDRARERFFQCYWLKSFNDIYRIKYITPEPFPPTGHFVQHLVRDGQGRLLPTEMVADLTFPEMHFDLTELSEKLTTPSERSLTQLWERLPSRWQTQNDTPSSHISHERAVIEAAFYKKMAIPWLCMIALLAPAPFCVAHRRPLRVFFVFAAAIFGIFAFFILLSVGHTLTHSQLASPTTTLIAPTLLAVALSVYAYARMR